METIQTPYGAVTVYINRLHSEEDPSFHISFVDNRNKLYIVLLQEVSDQWTISNKEILPDWVVALQTRFVLMVRREMLKEQEVPID